MRTLRPPSPGRTARSVALCALAATAATTTPPVAAAVPPPPASPAAIRQLADQAATTALATLAPDGRLWDPVGRNLVDYYGPAGYGYAGLRAAARHGDRALLERAVRAVLVSVRHRHATPFDHWLTAKAYAFAQRTPWVATDPAWTAVVEQVAAYVDEQPVRGGELPASDGWRDGSRYNNWKLVELAAAARARSAGRFGPTRTRERRLRAIARMATAAKAPAGSTRWVRGTVRALSDPPSNPIAYSAFSAAMLADASASAPNLIPRGLAARGRAVGRYLAAIAAPDGSVAWSGRSSDLSWTLAAAMVAGAQLRTAGGRALAAAAWRRLLGAYGLRSDGALAIAPVLVSSDDTSGIDRYANPAVYAGLTATLLNDAADHLDGQPPATGETPAATRDGVLDDRGGSGSVAQRVGPAWWAATTRPSSLDSRYAAGLQRIQIRGDGGRWHDVLPARPKVLRTEASAWPAPRRCVWKAVTATRLRCDAGELRIRARGRRSVNLDLRARPHQWITGHVYLAQAHRVSRRTVRWATGSLTATTPLRLAITSRGYSSATDQDLQLVRYRARTDSRGRLDLTFAP